MLLAFQKIVHFHTTVADVLKGLTPATHKNTFLADLSKAILPPAVQALMDISNK